MLRLDTGKLFAMQKQLDKRIEAEHGLTGSDLTEQKILALQVELGELANETRCFKFWSVKPPSERSVILEEYVDGLHFILSLGLAFGYEVAEPVSVDVEEELTACFLEVFERVSDFRRQPEGDRFCKLFFTYMVLGEQLGFTSDDIHSAYEDKNQTNHERQEQGY
ncbi:MAG TPA: dUTP diphosphatase [Bacillales bacterium]|nr:dUTP diphosphatase [Bacillales bacterium]